jgi:uncharacterized protein (DUF433 family)
MSSKQRVVHSDPEILGGTPVFIGTRVPIKTLLDYLEAGDSLDKFLDHFPSVSREQAIEALELAKEMLIAYANPA